MLAPCTFSFQQFSTFGITKTCQIVNCKIERKVFLLTTFEGPKNVRNALKFVAVFEAIVVFCDDFVAVIVDAGYEFVSITLK